MALLAMLRPGCIEKIEKSQSAVLLLLIDSTRSMQLPHIADDLTRWATTLEMVRKNESRFKRLAENKIDVRVFTFDNQIKAVEIEDGGINLSSQAEGSETDIGTAIFETAMNLSLIHI